MGGSQSEADLRVYRRMRAQVEAVQRPHHTLDTSGDVEAELSAIVREMTGA